MQAVCCHWLLWPVAFTGPSSWFIERTRQFNERIDGESRSSKCLHRRRLGFAVPVCGRMSHRVARPRREGEGMATAERRVLSVNVGTPRVFEFNGHQVKSAIWKSPVVGRVAARGVNLEGDDQADRKAHGGVDKAIYAYAIEDLRWWESELGRSLPVAQFGENLTTEGIEVNGALVGERWEVGTTLLEVAEPRVPCWRLGVRMDDMGFVRRSEEHTSELQSHSDLVCRLLLEKKKKTSVGPTGPQRREPVGSHC